MLVDVGSHLLNQMVVFCKQRLNYWLHLCSKCLPFCLNTTMMQHGTKLISA